MVPLQAEDVKESADGYANETAILALDPTDEPFDWIGAQETSDAMAATWTNGLIAANRQFDPQPPILVGTSSQEIRRSQTGGP